MTPNPKENKLKPGPSEESGGSGDDQQATGSGEEYDDEEIDVSLDDFDSVNSYLDSLNSALDAIEQRNDDLKEQLLSLLQSNREIRQSMQAENAKRTEGGGSGSGPEPEAASEDAMEH
ncbi:UPF0184 protein AAEL002161 [Aedes albopictus]|uniref:Bublin coiled-coil protein n=1 Tax=Aedes albopictus TaxID=7160 RepID=A0ABM1XIW5_AEDAL|nr:UPF0184 protein AAEL002161 [Aedes albopictus]